MAPRIKDISTHNDSLVIPYPKGHFDILPTPDFHFFIIASDTVEIFFGDGEEPTSKRGSPVDAFC